jgi:hypothetical protein
MKTPAWRHRYGIAAAALTMAAVTAASPAQASRRDCLARASAGKTVVETRHAVVYARGQTLRACVYSEDHAVVLPNQGRFPIEGRNGKATIDRRSVRLAGRYVAYSSKWYEAGHSSRPFTVQRVYVYDARFPDLKNRSDAHGEGPVGPLFLKPNGSVAWTYTSAPGSAAFPITYVYKMDTTGDGEQELDRDGPQSPDFYRVVSSSLAMSGDNRRLYWMRDPGGVQTGTIR